MHFATTTIAPATNTNLIRDAVARLEKIILKYIQHCTQHVKIMTENKIGLAQVQMEEYKALEHFKEIATPNQWNIHLILKSIIKQWSIKNKNYLTATKRVEYDSAPKFINNTDFTFRIDESIIEKEEPRRAASRGRSQRTRPNCCPDSYKIAGRGFPVPTIINEAKAKFTEEEYQLLKLGPRFIYNNPIAASRRQTTELAALKRKIETRFFEKKVSPGRSVTQFIATLDIIIKTLDDTAIYKTVRKHKNHGEIIAYDNLLETIDFNQYQLNKCPITTEKKKNYGRIDQTVETQASVAEYNSNVQAIQTSSHFFLFFSSLLRLLLFSSINKMPKACQCSPGGCGCGAGCEGGQCNCKDTCSCKCDCKSCSHDGTSCGSACECTDCKCSVCKCST
ncbi:unnamed protein product [Rotaria magnacalcarata]|uniref:Uncharacterized protein n=2 Tax=Rotaria magnacalcarata TaxID=392030 RepID=A0A815T9N8_9BILA|nr:unnamed protein product [Rotaria magnacalcarata]CAF1635408.1 unnamed protein product [Rotaria magnacalcarata]